MIIATPAQNPEARIFIAALEVPAPDALPDELAPLLPLAEDPAAGAVAVAEAPAAGEPNNVAPLGMGPGAAEAEASCPTSAPTSCYNTKEASMI